MATSRIAEEKPTTGPRVVLVTGKGGVGKTTLSAATALVAADRGARTLLVSTDEAHSLSDVLQLALGPEPAPVADALDGVQLDGRHELQRSWGSILHYLRRLLGATELDRLHLDELVMIPGLDQLVALARLRELANDGRWDAIVVDCAPSADSLRLLALPEVLGFYVERLFGRHGTLGTWTRRRIERSLAIPTPDDTVVSSVTALTDELAGLRTTLDSGRTTARIVLTPERVVIAEAQRTLAYLALYGYAVDAALVNRVPRADEAAAGSSDGQLDAVGAAFAALPLLTVVRRPAEPLGLDALRQVGRELYGGHDPLAELASVRPLSISARGPESVVRLPAPGIERDHVGLERDGDHLIVTLGPYRRNVRLPDTLRHQDVVKAGLDGGHIEVVFREAAGVA